jgi:hypothetical protein
VNDPKARAMFERAAKDPRPEVAKLATRYLAAVAKTEASDVEAVRPN